MPVGRNLSRDAATRRAALIDVNDYDVILDLADAAKADTFRCSTTIRFACHEPGATEFVDLAAARVLEATLNGSPVPLAGWSETTGLPLPGLAAENVLTVVAEFPYLTGARGMYRGVDPADGEVYLYTSFEPAAAQYVFACFDQPDLKAAFTFHVRVPATWRAISNMPVTSTEPDGDTAIVHFAQTPRMSTYIAAVCAGPYAEIRSTVGGRDQGIFCRPSMVEHLDADEIFDVTRRGMDFYEEQFGQPYPLPKYDHVAAPGYLGAMENFGCIVFGERLLIFRSRPTNEDRALRAMIILHELAHMWFGDLVTMRWWDDLWLNEAFATWAAVWSMNEATDWPEPWATFAVQTKRAGIEADQVSSTHPIAADIPDVQATETNFDAITYRKGASVLKQLAAYVGIDAFTSALKGYFAERAWRNASLADLVNALAEASGRPVREFASIWLETAQVNTLRPELSVHDGQYTVVAVRQEAPPGYPTLRPHRLAVGLYDLVDGRLVRRERVELDVDGERTEVPELAGQPVADVVLLNDDDLTYAKVRLDPRSLDTVVEHIADFDSALARAICWAAAIDMLNDAELATRDFVTLVARGIAVETDTALVSAVLTELVRALKYYADPDWAPQGWATMAGLADAALATAPAGSSIQLTWARAFAEAARTPAEVERLRGWYAGTGLPDGLRLDADLRWFLLQELVTQGAAGADEIEAEAARDQTTNGVRSAAHARALIPQAQAKADAWDAAIVEAEIPAEIRVAQIAGYTHPAHAALLPAHLDTYLSTIEALWNEGRQEIARRLAVLGFPAGQVDPATVEVVQRWLDAGDRPLPLYRYVSEGRDRMIRALAARARDRSAAAA